ncbi:MAG: hypothetical protein HAW61_01140 [Candidatus Portiera sp.]|nr:hypothetical protein [Portiera sp.]
MKLTGYFLPNLIFLLLIVLAWINIGWVQNTFTYLEEQDTTKDAGPILVMHNGKQEYSSPPATTNISANASSNIKQEPASFYSMEFSLLQAYANKSIQVDNPAITGYSKSRSKSSSNDSARDDFKINGLSLLTDGDNKLRINGKPASFTFTGDSVQARGSAANILYDVDKRHWLLLADNDTPASKISWKTAANSKIIASATSIGLSQPDRMSQLIGKVQIEYFKSSNTPDKLPVQLLVLSDRAAINGNNDEIFLEGQVRMEHLTKSKLVTATARNGYYKLDEEFILSGEAKIRDYTDDSSISAEKILYNPQTSTWRILAKSTTNDKNTRELKDKIEIILPQ